MKLFKERILPAIFMIIALLLFSFITQFFGPKNSQFGFGIRTFSLVTFSLILIFAFYEISKVFRFEKMSQIVIICIALAIFFSPFLGIFYDPLLDIEDQKKILYSKIISNHLQDFFSSWYVYMLFTIFYLTQLVRELIINRKILKQFNVLNSIFYRVNLFFIPSIFIILGLKFLCLLSFSNYLIYLLIIIVPIISDVSGFFVGGMIGKKIIKRNLSSISPKKSWEGAIASFLFSSIFIVLFLSLTPALDSFALLADLSTKSVTISIFSLTLPVMAMLGDLVFSLIKRAFEIKDYSNIFKGHGGLLDRIDSLLLVSSTCCILIVLISI